MSYRTNSLRFLVGCTSLRSAQTSLLRPLLFSNPTGGAGDASRLAAVTTVVLDGITGKDPKANLLASVAGGDGSAAWLLGRVLAVGLVGAAERRQGGRVAGGGAGGRSAGTDEGTSAWGDLGRNIAKLIAAIGDEGGPVARRLLRRAFESSGAATLLQRAGQTIAESALSVTEDVSPSALVAPLQEPMAAAALVVAFTAACSCDDGSDSSTSAVESDDAKLLRNFAFAVLGIPLAVHDTTVREQFKILMRDHGNVWRRCLSALRLALPAAAAASLSWDGGSHGASGDIPLGRNVWLAGNLVALQPMFVEAREGRDGGREDCLAYAAVLRRLLPALPAAMFDAESNPVTVSPGRRGHGGRDLEKEGGELGDGDAAASSDSDGGDGERAAGGAGGPSSNSSGTTLVDGLLMQPSAQRARLVVRAGSDRAPKPLRQQLANFLSATHVQWMLDSCLPSMTDESSGGDLASESGKGDSELLRGTPPPPPSGGVHLRREASAERRVNNADADFDLSDPRFDPGLMSLPDRTIERVSGDVSMDGGATGGAGSGAVELTGPGSPGAGARAAADAEAAKQAAERRARVTAASAGTRIPGFDANSRDFASGGQWWRLMSPAERTAARRGAMSTSTAVQAWAEQWWADQLPDLTPTWILAGLPRAREDVEATEDACTALEVIALLDGALSAWGRDSVESLAKRSGSSASASSLPLNSPSIRLLNSVAFAPRRLSLMRRMWAHLQADTLLATHRDFSCDALGTVVANPLEADALSFFLSTLKHVLFSLSDEELLSWPTGPAPLALDELEALRDLLSVLLYRFCWESAEVRSATMAPQQRAAVMTLTSEAISLITALHNRASLRAAWGPRAWLWPRLPAGELTPSAATADLADDDGEALSGIDMLPPGASARAVLVLHRLPWVVPFQDRVALFTSLGMHARDRSPWGTGPRLRVRRDRIFEDSYEGIAKLVAENGPGVMRDRLQVSFVNEAGLEEAGVDGGGLFKEWMDVLSARAFDPQYGMLVATPEQTLAPNPASRAVAEDDESQLRFLGVLLGKAVYESLLIEPEFAGFFLNKLLGKANQVDDLASLDPELARSLLSLKTFDGNWEDLCLFFEVSEERLGTSVTHELVPGGSEIPVTAANVQQYIGMTAHHMLNQRIARQCRAFVSGFASVVPLSWIRMFNREELALIIGGTQREIDVEAWRQATNYSGGYHERHPVIVWLWEVVTEMSHEDRAALLRFLTSVPRPPLLGFRHLQPALCVMQVPITDDAERLPTSATCMNLLKLPNYSSKEVLREKLLLSVHEARGFELS